MPCCFPPEIIDVSGFIGVVSAAAGELDSSAREAVD